MFSEEINITLKDVCLEIAKRYELKFLEIGVDKDHVHFLVQSVPTYSPTKIVTMIKSITAREIFKKHPEVEKIFWGGEFWSDGYFVNTVSKYGSETTIKEYVSNQGKEKEYEQLYNEQLQLFFKRYPVRLRRGASFIFKFLAITIYSTIIKVSNINKSTSIIPCCIFLLFIDAIDIYI